MNSIYTIDQAPLPAESPIGQDIKINNFFDELPQDNHVLDRLPARFKAGIAGVYRISDIANHLEIEDGRYSGQEALTVKANRNDSSIALKLYARISMPDDAEAPKLFEVAMEQMSTGYPLDRLGDGVLGMVAARLLALELYEKGEFSNIYVPPIALISNTTGEIVGYATPWIEGRAVETLSGESLSDAEFELFLRRLEQEGLAVDDMDVARNAVVISSIPLDWIVREDPEHQETLMELTRAVHAEDRQEQKLMDLIEGQGKHLEDIPRYYQLSVMELQEEIVNKLEVKVDSEMKAVLDEMQKYEMEAGQIRSRIGQISLRVANDYLGKNNLPYTAELDPKTGTVKNIKSAQSYVIDIGVDYRSRNEVLEFLGLTSR